MRRALKPGIWACLLIALPLLARDIDARRVTRIDYAAPDFHQHGVFRRAGVGIWYEDRGAVRRHARFAELGRDLDNVYLVDVRGRLYVRLDLASRQVFVQQGRYGDEHAAFRIVETYAVGPENVSLVIYADADGREAGRFQRRNDRWIETWLTQEIREWRESGHDESSVFLDIPSGEQTVRLDIYGMQITRSRADTRGDLQRQTILEIEGPPGSAVQSSPSR